MDKCGFTLAMYRVRPGSEEEFIKIWDELAETFSSLPDPPIWGMLVRNNSDPTLFYSFGPWRTATDVQAMRANPLAQEAFARIGAVCVEVTPSDYEILRHVKVQDAT